MMNLLRGLALMACAGFTAAFLVALVAFAYDHHWVGYTLLGAGMLVFAWCLGSLYE